MHSDLSSGSETDFLDLYQTSETEADALDSEHRSYDKFAHENQTLDSESTAVNQELKQY